MKISGLIKKLEDIKTREGDLPIYVFGYHHNEDKEILYKDDNHLFKINDIEQDHTGEVLPKRISIG